MENLTEQQIEIFQCWWRENKFHNEENCRIFKKGNAFYHEYGNRSYSIHCTEGKPMVSTIENLQRSIYLSDFNLNNNTCNMVSLPFTQNEYTHLYNLIPQTCINFWNVIRNLTWFWDNIVHRGNRVNIKCGRRIQPLPI